MYNCIPSPLSDLDEHVDADYIAGFHEYNGNKYYDHITAIRKVYDYAVSSNELADNFKHSNDWRISFGAESQNSIAFVSNTESQLRDSSLTWSCQSNKEITPQKQLPKALEDNSYEPSISDSWNSVGESEVPVADIEPRPTPLADFKSISLTSSPSYNSRLGDKSTGLRSKPTIILKSFVAIWKFIHIDVQVVESDNKL